MLRAGLNNTNNDMVSRDVTRSELSSRDSMPAAPPPLVDSNKGQRDRDRGVRNGQMKEGGRTAVSAINTGLAIGQLLERVVRKGAVFPSLIEMWPGVHLRYCA